MQKIIFIAHGHPSFSKGGAEIAAWNLFRKFKEEGWEALFIARDGRNPHAGSTFSTVAEDEILLHSAIDNWFNFTNQYATNIFRDLGEFVSQFSPDVIHVHHFAHIGLEVFPTLRKAAPKATILLTLHEYMAICAHNGTMVKPETLKLCFKSSVSDCNQCYPSHAPGDFFLRKHFILDQFSYVDHFISPSEFLKARYVDWGLEENQISVLENYLSPMEKRKPRALTKGEKRTRFAYFGQATPFKGLDILLSAMLLIPKSLRKILTLEIHGANIDILPEEHRENIKALLKKCKNMVTLRGPYESNQLNDLMGECDWVVMPSIWWENSPIVIQEAIAIGRPLIVADIGGMKEKVQDKAGLTFSARSPASLASTMQQAVSEKIFNDCVDNLPITKCMFDEYLAAYENS